jgi:hypothetical protein
MDLLWLVATGGVSLWGYFQTRQFVRKKLRFVDAVEKPGAPLAVGAVAALAASPVAWLLPIVTVPTAVVFGLGVGVGMRHGARDVRRLPGG